MLTLPIMGKWFNMILSGEKQEEYREIKPYYKTRFKKIFNMHPNSYIPVGIDTSLKASNFICEGAAGGTHWTGCRDKGQDIPRKMKTRWIRILKAEG